MIRQHVTEARVAELDARLSPTERAVIETLDLVRVATAPQLERLLFTGVGTSTTVARRARRLLRRLVSLRILGTLDRRIGGAKSGSAGYVYSLDVAGQRLASAAGPAGGTRIRRPWTPGTAFIDHALSVTELYVRLREAERDGTGELIEFWAEPECWRSFTGLGGARQVLKPDAFVRLAADDVEYLSFVEVDRATQSLPAISRKLGAYRRYFQTGREEARFGVFPRVVFLVPSEARKQALVDLFAKERPEYWPLFTVTGFDDALGLLAGRES